MRHAEVQDYASTHAQKEQGSHGGMSGGMSDGMSDGMSGESRLRPPTRRIKSLFPVLGRKRPYLKTLEVPEDPHIEEGMQGSHQSAAAFDHGESTSQVSTIPSLSKHKQGHYDPDWEREYPWVYPSDDGKGMFYKLCQRFNTCNERNSSAIFNITLHFTV